MYRRRDFPTSEEIAEVTGDDPEVLERAPEGLRFVGENGEEITE